MKKKILLLTSIASVSIFSAAAVLFASRPNLKTVADDDVNSYQIDFDGNDCLAESSGDPIFFTLSKEKGIDGLYDITSVGETGVSASNYEGLEFDVDDYILFAETPGDFTFKVYFSLDARANFDYLNSYIEYFEDDSAPQRECFLEPELVDDKWLCENYVTFSIWYGTVTICKVHLEFSCAK